MAKLSKRLDDLRASPVRAMLEIATRPGVVSFAGGLPAPESFAELTPPPNLKGVMQYGPSVGEAELRTLVAEELRASGLDCGAESILILSGSQQGIDLTAKLIVDAGSRIALEAPTYLAALQVFRFFGAEFEALDAGAPGQAWTPDDHPSMAYVIPTFQNPTGRCWTLAQREAFAKRCEDEGVILFEDDPYRELAYTECDRRPIASMMTKGSWIYQGSFSKTLAPGLRLGFMAASPDLFPHLLLLKQAADLHTNRVSQHMVIDYLKTCDQAARRTELVTQYHEKRDRFAAQMERHFGNNASWDIPEGGLFFWVTLPDHVDVDALFDAAVAKNVLFTPGRHFYAGAKGEGQQSAMRLNFSHASAEDAEKGLAILGELLRG